MEIRILKIRVESSIFKCTTLKNHYPERTGKSAWLKGSSFEVFFKVALLLRNNVAHINTINVGHALLYEASLTKDMFFV